MSNKHAARLGGDDYQHLYSWLLVLQLKDPSTRVSKVTLEDKNARSIDDVTVKYEEGVTEPDRFYQLKYHTDYRESYTAEKLIQPQQGKESLLEKFWYTWQYLHNANPDRHIELWLISDWTWGDDGLGSMIKTDGKIKIDDFISSSAPNKVKSIRTLWQTKLKADEADFQAFLKCLRFQLGYNTNSLTDYVKERMKRHSLKTDTNTLIVVAGIIRGWIKHNQCEVTLDTLNAKIKEHDLYEPVKSDQCVSVMVLSPLRLPVTISKLNKEKTSGEQMQFPGKMFL